jgi:arylsulfatase A
MSRIIARCGILVLLLILVGRLPAAQKKTARPNVILILTDDQGWWDLGAHDNQTIETPVMDRLATQGAMFSRFYCSPVCSPTRAALMIGRHTQHTGAIDTHMGGDVLGRCVS